MDLITEHLAVDGKNDSPADNRKAWNFKKSPDEYVGMIIPSD
jgi:hypothetical protein